MDTAPQCYQCRHVRPPRPGTGWQCAAFDDIPKEIMVNAVDHREPYPGDNGVRFEPRFSKADVSYEEHAENPDHQCGFCRHFDLPGSCGLVRGEINSGGWCEKWAAKAAEDMRLATDPPVSEKQRRAMWAAAAGHSNLGIPESVGKEFANADPGGKLPAKAKDMGRSGWQKIKEGLAALGQFFGEEEEEPEHAEDVLPRAASVAFTTRDGRVLMLRRSRDERNYPDHWAFPGGKADGDETHEEAAARECREEIGDCALDGMREIRRVRTPNGLDHVTYAVPVEDTFAPRLNGEHSEYAWVPADELPERTHPGVRAAVDAVFEESKHKRDEGGKFSSGGGEVVKASGTGVVHKGTENLAAHGMKPKGRAGGTKVSDAAAVAWYTAKRDKRNVTAYPTAYGWKIAREEDKIPHGQPHVVVTPDGVMHKFLREDSASDETFEKLEGELAHKPGVRDPEALAAWIGREHGKIASDRIGDWPYGGMAEDRASVRTIDDSGHMHVNDSVLTKAVVSPYLGSEINGVMGGEPGWVPLEPDRKYHLLRDPKELQKALKTFNGLPLLWRHQSATADEHPADIVIGATGTNAKFDEPDLTNDLVIWPKYATQAVEDGKKKSLSCGYGYRAVMEPGSHNGQHYDGRMIDIKGNHVALVDQPRVPGAKVGGDSMDEVLWQELADAIRSYA